MRKAYIIHGWDGSPREPMHQWMKNELEGIGFSVEIPRMPNPEKPEIEPWVKKLFEIVDLKEEVYLIGHSIGCQAILRYLEKLENNIKVKGVVLIAPWIHLDEKTIEEEGEEVKEMAKPWMETPINWKDVRSHVNNNVVCILSDNDPYVPLTNADLFREKLNANIIIEHNKFHFDVANGITENKTAVDEIIKIKEKD